MNPLSSVLLLVAAAVSLLAGIGILRFDTTYARLHAAGKASPVAFLLAAASAGVELGVADAERLAVASVALVLTVPVGVHLLFRAVHRTTNSSHLVVDDLADGKDDHIDASRR